MGYDVAIRRQDISALFDLKGDPEAVRDWAGAHLPAFPAAPNTQTCEGALALYHIGRNYWILRAPLDREGELNAGLNPADAPPAISVVCISDTLSFFTITGPDADQIMAIACPLDLHPSAFGEDAVTYTEAFGLKALVLRCDGGFEIAADQSYGDMLEDYLSRATT